MIPRGIPRCARAVLGALLLLPGAALAQGRGEGVLEARVWLDRGEEPVLRRGESARLYYRASRDAFVAIFHIDTNGGARLIYPRSPDETNLVRGGFDYRLLFPRSPVWQVEDDPGVGYFFMVASPRRLDFSRIRYSRFDRGWDISRVGREVYRDPYVAMDDYVAALIPDWEEVPYALDFVSYHVDGRHEYPRFLCYNCHAFRPYAAWNPYAYDCTSFRVVVYDDPYYYPATRYRGSRVVYVRPTNAFEPRFDFKERASGESAAPLRLAERRSTPGIWSESGTGTGPSVPIRGGDAGETRRPAGGSVLAPPLGAGPSFAPPQGGQGGRAGTGSDATGGRPSAVLQDERSRPVLQPRPSDTAAPPRQGPPAGSVQPPRPDGTTPTRPPAGGAQPRPDVSSPTRPSSGGAQPRPDASAPTTRPSGGAVQSPTRPETTAPPSGSPPSLPAPRRPPPGGPQER